MDRTAAESTPHYRVQLDLPPELYRWLMDEAARRSVPLDQVVRQMLERVAQTEKVDFDITQTLTWQFCGALEVFEPDLEHIVGRDAQGHEITNYAEHVDALLYRGS
ncbi:MAG: hypothetical protein EXR62_02500 [Chloroflexi bacterium]|nr:hypothetical protein [Chloroflexota bacterium]